MSFDKNTAILPTFTHMMDQILLQEAAEYCVDVFKDYTVEEITKMPPSIQNCWDVGQKLAEVVD
ncbi:hypothetical protein VP424E501_P0039 [Vibrio phage 424E50-1]|nr:hypothetical protein VP424E501_P0039 [Vibrio phage 424E50-1]